MESYLFIFLISLLPLLELRIAIPVGYFFYQTPLCPTLIAALLGSFTATILSFTLLHLLFHHPFFQKLFHRWLQKLHQKHIEKYQKLGLFFLLLLVALPLPGSGVYTGSLLTFLFDLPRKKAFWAIILGTTLCGIIVALLIKSGMMAYQAMEAPFPLPTPDSAQ